MVIIERQVVAAGIAEALGQQTIGRQQDRGQRIGKWNVGEPDRAPLESGQVNHCLPQPRRCEHGLPVLRFDAEWHSSRVHGERPDLTDAVVDGEPLDG
ncbi:MAG: hypothetical protein AMS21_05795 [Gemmatimonas sp. SG8_38_2]|nr:MAG: hypothetical protein AMS21_05795 [Gemmatimonas sp. SG8_38_2]